LALLAKAMDGRDEGAAHPGFASIISALSADEVGPLAVVLRTTALVSVEVRAKYEDVDRGFVRLMDHVLNLQRASGAPYVNAMLPAYVDNWVRLGLVDVRYDTWSTSVNAYEWVAGRPEWEEARRELESGQTLTYQKGLVRRTRFGQAFAHAVGIKATEAVSGGDFT
jgi:hypothetical protein